MLMFRWVHQNSTVRLSKIRVVQGEAQSAFSVLVKPAISVVPGPHDRVAVPVVNIAREDSDESNADIESDTLSVHEHADVQEELPHESESVELGSVISGADEKVDEVEVEEVEDVAATRFAPAGQGSVQISG